ncbi:neutral/alkaline non-lysosomal ceramidase N-terminal domain-containing protein [Verrucomicrobiales bacterium BCK34]|nr:neutral/alkaline non-lysosomal ceramidase N-terminal domain-containing protein [Verrucomicrobiales bacterium BCK34]
MKFPLALFIIAVTAFAPISQSRAALEAGTAMVEITPDEWPVTLRGSFSPKGATSAHDPLNARSLALRNGEGRVVITVVDILYLAQDVVDEIKKDAAAATGWDTSEMLISGTHTHSAPNISEGNDAPAEVAFRKKARKNISLAIQTAIKNLQPAQAGFTKGELKEEVFNRRWYLEEGKMPENPFGEIDTVKMNPSRSTIVSPAGPTDPNIEVINVQKTNGKPLGLLANYALHYVGGTDGSVSADYYGEFSRLIANRIGGSSPGDFLGIMSNGTSGDINNIDFSGTRPPRAKFEQIGLVATKAADEVWRATKDLKYEKDLPIGIRERRVTLKYRKPDEALVKRAHEILAMNEEERKTLPRLADHYAVRTLATLEMPDTVDVVIQAIRIGDQAIFALPFEVLVEIGMDLKKQSPLKHTMIIELANGAFGYLPPPHQHELGGYETWLGTNRVQKDASVILTKHLLEMMGELKGAE